jgi:seryl-tRNA synthetase
VSAGAATAAASYRHAVALPSNLPPAGREYLVAALKRSYAVTALVSTPDGLDVTLEEAVTPAELSSQVQRLLTLAMTLKPDVRFRQTGRGTFTQDPTPTLTGRGDVMPVAPGMVAMAGPFLGLTRAIDRYWLDRAIARGAREEEYPILWPVDLYRRIDYFHEFPQQVLLAAPVHETFAARNAFAASHRRQDDYATVDSATHLAPSRNGLQSAVCDCCYYLRRDTRDQPDTWFTTAGRVFRNEVSPTGGLDRLLSFRVRDLMAVGSEAFVRRAQEQMLADAAEFLAGLGLTCRIETAGDPFFANDSVLKNLFQEAAQLKYELKVPLPHDGRDVAIGSVNLHQDFFGRNLDIQLPDGSPAWSACLGIGFERAAYAICCQYGPDPAVWPDLVTPENT